VAWIVGRGGISTVRLPPRSEIEKAVARLLPTLQSPEASIDERAQSWLFETLLAPVVERLTEGGHLIVVPHAILHYLPFEVLADGRGRYLVERYTTSYAASVSSFAHLRNEGGPRQPGVLAVGSPATPLSAVDERGSPLAWASQLRALPHSRAELRRIAATFRGRTRVLEGSRAIEEALSAEMLGDVGILHFATHALIDEDRPDRSGLALSPHPAGSDGILQTREVYRLPLERALVTLSACQTALGREVTGEGLLSVARAFFFAGASAVTASLWNVSDRSTADLMARFYQRIHEGASFDLALADAKRAFLGSTSVRRHPYYWAPFVLMGHARATLDRPEPAAGTPLYVLAVTVVALAGCLIIVLRRGRRSATARA
jgi:CHAT domain-containing protein